VGKGFHARRTERFIEVEFGSSIELGPALFRPQLGDF